MYEEDEYEVETDSSENELIRVDWDYEDGALFDPRENLKGALEFKESMQPNIDDLLSDEAIYLKNMNDSTEPHQYP